MEGAKLLTHSRLRCMRDCPRRHWYRYEAGVRPIRTAPALRRGAAFHKALELRAGGMAVEDAVIEATIDYATIPDWIASDEEADDWMAERELVVAMALAYFEVYAGDGIEVVENEFRFDVPIVNPETGSRTNKFRLGGKVDKIVRLPDGRLALQEHKTAGEDISPGSDYWKRLRIDPQISLYTIAARDCGFDVQTVLYDVVRTPGIKPRQVRKSEKQDLVNTGEWYGRPVRIPRAGRAHIERETPAMYGARVVHELVSDPERYFQRQEIPRLEADIEEARKDLWDQQQFIAYAQNGDRWPRNADACGGRGKAKCDYLDICHTGLTIEGQPPEGFTLVNDIHPELAEDA